MLKKLIKPVQIARQISILEKNQTAFLCKSFKNLNSPVFDALKFLSSAKALSTTLSVWKQTLFALLMDVKLMGLKIVISGLTGKTNANTFILLARSVNKKQKET